MISTTIVRYSIKPDQADENQRLIEAVFAELSDRAPTGLQYVAYRLDDGVSFVHVAVLDGEKNPLTTNAAFAQFQADLADRCTTPPHVSGSTAIASYG